MLKRQRRTCEIWLSRIAHRIPEVERLRQHGETLREDFAALHAWEFHPGFDECVAALRTALSRSLPPPVLEQERCPYQIGHGRFIRTSAAEAVHPGI